MRTRYVCRTCIAQFAGTTRSPSNRLRNSVRRSYTTAAVTRPFRCAIIGSGPAGFYSAHRLLKKIPDVRIDMYEALPSPFGLVRFGVAPDHPEVKNCIDTFSEVAAHDTFTFVGNVSIGNKKHQLPLKALTPHYDAILFAYGASRDRRLDVPGEDLKGVLSARAFVGWYNGLPEYADLAPPLDSGEEAVVIGQGNVALDVARTLLSPLDRLRGTDMTENAIETLSKSRVKRVRIVGRRGPLQAPYTIKEIRELLQLPAVAFEALPKGLLPDNPKKLPRQLSRIAQLLEKGSTAQRTQAEKEWTLLYMRSPTGFSPSGPGGDQLGGVRFEEMEYTVPPSTIALDDLAGLRNLRVRKKEGGVDEVLPTTLAFKSVGYLSEPIEGFEDLGIPFDKQMGIIPNDLYGRVMAPDRGPGGLAAGHVSGVYCAGWVKRGPTGVIASTMDDAFTSADVVAKDWGDRVPFLGEGGGGGEKKGWEEVQKEVRKRGIRSVDWRDWKTIDEEEKRRGREKGKEREKCKSVEEMLRILDG